MDDLSFDKLGISKELLNAVEKLGFKKTSEVQARVIPLALDNRDIIVKSQTGSGKTAAYAIPICEKIELENNKPQALVLTPTRELAVQVKEEISSIGRFKRIRCSAVFGKQPMEIQTRELKQRIHVVAGTPGRTMDHIERGNIDLSQIKYLIIDEADKMLNMGFIEQVEAIIKEVPDDRVTMLFSATIPEEIEMLCSKYMKNPEKVEIVHETSTAEKIKQSLYEVDEKGKFELLNKIIYTERPDSCILFCNTKEKVDNLNQRMKEAGFNCREMHGGMEQKDRLDTIQSFKKGEFGFLVATDVAARGIDVEDIGLVINYDLPVEMESYVHRIGRTGRAGKGGNAVTFASPYEGRKLNELEEYIGYSIPKGEIPSEEEVENGKKIYGEKANKKAKPKKDRSFELNRGITKIYIGGGKKKKIRPGDIAGTISSIEGVEPDDIGIIDVQDTFSYVDILNGKGKLVLDNLEDLTIKGKKVRVQKALK